MTESFQESPCDQPAPRPVPQPDPDLVRRSRGKLLLIFACFGVPLLAATIWLQVVRGSGGTVGDTSRGELVTPAHPFESFELVTAKGDPWALAELRGRWTLLTMPGADGCDETCRMNLYHMRQVRLALNQRMKRVQRVVLAPATAPLEAALVEEHPGLVVLDGIVSARAAFVSQIRTAEAAAGMRTGFDGIYVVDPNGNLMMRFAPDLDPRAMLKDLKHLLKISRIG